MIIGNLIYILQSENYDFLRFLKFVYRNLAWWNLQKRQEIVWTPKARFLQVIAWPILFLSVAVFVILFGQWGFFSLVIFFPMLPFIIGLAFVVAKPLDIVLKQRIINKAKKIIADLDLVVVGVAGSYGKTSTKEILAAMLAKKFVVLKTPENINTDLGIAEFVINNRSDLENTDVFVVEMGAYVVGDIRKICEMVSPGYSIMTGINESHLERFGSIQNTIRAKFELPVNTKKLSILNFDDINIKENYDKFIIKNAVGISLENAVDIVVKENLSGIGFKYENILFETRLLAKHNVTLILMCLRIALELGMDISKVQQAVNEIKPVAHRLEPLYNKATDVMVIDDSYNGNFDGIKSGIEVLSRAKGRKIVLTPGLVELGDASKAVHEKISELYAANVDLVLLIKSPMTDYIVSGLKKNNYSNFHVYKDTSEAHGDLGNVMKRGDTIIFQNDLTDNYF